MFSFGREPNAAGPSATRINGALLPPLVFRVLALQFLFELRIGLAPERPEILGHLHRAVVRRERLDAERDAAGSNGERVRAVQILNARGERRRAVGGVGDYSATTGFQLDAARNLFVDQRLLLLRKPGFHHRPDLPVFDFLVTDCAEADLLDNGGPVVFGDGR